MVEDHDELFCAGEREKVARVELLVVAFELLDDFTAQVHDLRTQAAHGNFEVDGFVVQAATQELGAVAQVDPDHVLIQQHLLDWSYSRQGAHQCAVS